MSDHVYKVITLVGSSPDGIEAAVDNALKKAGESVRNMRWFEVKETRGHITDGSVAHYQVKVEVGFTLDESP
ncbi:dodecin domain-containing protein [Lujinxingia vulgaris]|uniref:Dodecin domain-containing protein n=1 Tax=Lujinxingia vulgaris TaxID=2600176 RepID=A0A5C6X4G6_9DELT|nr:dodecin [Lujinxingia vulgaris]TXD36636.1 dodecin domain-containing protein [Lujinxingia vulgaris]